MENFFTIPWARLFLLLLLVYIIVAILTWFYGDKLLFPAPSKAKYSDDEVSFYLKLNGGDSIACMHYGNRESPQVSIIFSHGNGEDLGNLKSFLSFWSSNSIEMIAYDYPGYGLSEGNPSEQGCYDAIDAVYEELYLRNGRDPSRIIAWGRSLGTGPSLYLAAKHKVGGLILETPFLSAFRSVTGFTMLPWDRFRNVERTKDILCPSLVIHGTLDEVVPFRQGKQISKELPDPKKFIEVEGAEHNNLMEIGGERYEKAIHEFISSIQG